MANWQDAARRYREAAQIKTQETQQTAQLGYEKPLHSPADVLQATRELEQFLRSDEGRAALDLLTASNRHINFGEEYEGGGSSVVFFIDGTGLNRSIEASGTWTVYAKEVPKPKITPITAKEAIEAAINPRMGGKKPNEVMTWLRSQLDAIASHAPETAAK
jgi:hypothetical protein